MIFYCPNPKCRKEIAHSFDYCRFCGCAVSEKARKEQEVVECPNCGSSIVNKDDYCRVCGLAISEKARKGQKPFINRKKPKEVNENQLLKQKLSDIQKDKSGIEKELTSINEELQSYKIQLDDEQKKNKELENMNDTPELIPKWLSVCFSIIAVVFLVLLFILRNRYEQ
jgi:DNA repair exonuclease SbcCD ATPase subunit